MTHHHVHDHGFTLIELMIVVLLIAIGAALAAPNFNEIVRDTRLTTQANNVLASLQLARTEAVTRSVQVTVRKNGNVNQNWDGGWLVFTDWDADGQFDGNANVTDCSIQQDCILRTETDLEAGLTLRSGANYHQWVAFLPSGVSVGSGGVANDTFRLCDSTGNLNDGRSLVINNTGRPSVTEGVAACP